MKFSKVFVYMPGSGILHRVNPVLKITWMFSLSIAIFFFDIKANFIFFILLIALLKASEVRVFSVLSSLKGIYLILALSLIGNLFLTPGEQLFEIFGLVATYEGLINGVNIFMRLINLFIASLAVSFTTSQLELSESFEVILSPLKIFRVNVAEIAFILTLTIRALMILLQETEDLLKVYKARGIIGAKRNSLKNIFAAFYLIMPLIILTLKRSEEMAFALMVRGYNPYRKRILLKKRAFERFDFLFLVANIIIFSLLLIIGRIF